MGLARGHLMPELLASLVSFQPRFQWGRRERGAEKKALVGAVDLDLLRWCCSCAEGLTKSLLLGLQSQGWELQCERKKS